MARHHRTDAPALPSKPAPASATLRRRMLRVVMTTTLAALLLSCITLLLYELDSQRKSWAEDLSAQAELVGQLSLPALRQADSRGAQQLLALLKARPQIEMAALYDREGRLLAGYANAGEAPLQSLARSASDSTGEPFFDNKRFELRQPLREGGLSAAGGAGTAGAPATSGTASQTPLVTPTGALLGTLVLRAPYDVLPRLVDYLAILAAVLLASLALAALVAGQLQRAITEPIVAVSEVAREVVLHRNFALRAPRRSDDEVGTLVDNFNDMLAELGTQSAELKAADTRKDEFLATLAHELRNPLAPVATALSILARGDVDAGTQGRLVAMMQRQMQQFVRLIDDLMEVSRISTGQLQPRLERLDLVQVLRGAVENVAPALLEHGHTLTVDWPPPVWVMGDRTRLGQVFANLLGNAAKYTPPGGRIAILFSLRPDHVAVHVRDSGIGIAPEQQSEVFEMFVQLDRTLESGRSGLGVGLSLARQLVQLHNGTLALHSAGRGQGATFTVRLPRLAPADAALEADAPVPSGPAPSLAPISAPTAAMPPALPPRPTEPIRPLRVLVADDNRDFADSLAAMLGADGHAVQLAYDGPTALRAAQAALPDVGLFDVGMPGLDGYELAAAVRRQPGGERCLLVAITGWGQPSDRRRAHDAGYDEHLVKPVEADTLQAVLAHHR